LYRKKDPESPDEEECQENLFLCLCTALLHPENQDKFLACEGMELMVRCLKEQKHAAICALRVVKYATSNNHRACCEKFVAVGGLKYAFPALMGRGLSSSVKKKISEGAGRDAEETAIAVVSQLVSTLFDCPTDDVGARLLLKFTENEGEKLDRCSELFAKYVGVLQATERQLEATAAALQEAGDDEGLEDFCSAENTYAQRLTGGLFTLQLLSAIIVFVCVHDSSSGTSRNSVEKVRIKLGADGLAFSDVLDVLREAATQMSVEEDSKASSGEVGEEVDESARKKQSRVLLEWTRLLAPLVEDSEDENDEEEEEEDVGEN
jgi:beta-catenin-like protein 1